MPHHTENKAVAMPRRPRPHFSFKVETPTTLLAFLTEVALKDRSRTTVKQLLHDRFISVNETPTTQFDTPLEVGDVVGLHPSPLPKELHHEQVQILWQDDHLVMIHKEAGIPTVASGEEKDVTAMLVVSQHLKKFNARAKVFLLNRVDKDSAGFVLMAKSQALQEEIIDHWDDYIVHQQFVVSVEGNISEETGILTPPTPKDDKGERNTSAKGRSSKGTKSVANKEAGTARYRRLTNLPTGALLSIELLSGRNNQLRKQFAALKRPIIGDWRNGSRFKELGYVALDSMAFSFIHPVNGKRYDFDQPIPNKFRRLVQLTKEEEEIRQRKVRRGTSVAPTQRPKKNKD